VNVRDRNNVDHIAVRLLIANDHFGEIALLYHTRRSVSVICRNYNTMAKLGVNHFRDIISSFPKFKKAVKIHAYKYDDVNITFKMKCLKKLTYLNELNISSFHNFMHMLERQTF
jgi:CRP-like cAMP-binding protein